MADYTLVRMGDSIRDKAILAYDSLTDTIVDSGATYGPFEALSATSIDVGLQAMESCGEQVAWTNQNSLVTYTVPWAIMDETNPGGSFDRFYGPKQTVVRFDDRSAIITNPPDMSVTIPVNTLSLSFNLTWPEAQTGVVFEWFKDVNKPPIWRTVHDVSQGVQDEIWETPLAYQAGVYTLRMRRLDGSPLKVMGNPVTQYAGYSVTYREWTEKPLATQEFVQQSIAAGGGALDNVMLKSDYDPDKDGSVNLADKLKGVDEAASSSYYGKDDTGAIGFHVFAKGSEAELAADISALKTAVNSATEDRNHLLLELSVNTAEINKLKVAAQNMNRDITGLKNSKADGLTAVADKATKKITITLTAGGRVIDTDIIDLSGWFSGSNPTPTDTHKIYYGFTEKEQNDVLESDIIAGHSEDVNTINGHDVHITRADTTLSYIWIWLPDALGLIQGFTFSNFLSVWNSEQISVNQVPGKLYQSPNKTEATDVTFEVTV